MRLWLVLALLLAFAACGALRRGRAGDSNAVTLCVVNSTNMGTLTVWSDHFGRTHNVSGGERQCRPVGNGSISVRLYAETTGGGIAGPARAGAILRASPGECWLWNVRGVGDSQSLVPCDVAPS